jgi:arabinogalactan endo-1,4-beta-galactosidase
MMKHKFLLSLSLLIVAASAGAQTMFVCSGGRVTPYNVPSVGNVTFSTNGTKLQVVDKTYSVSDIDSITFEAPSTMKYVGGDISRLPQFEAASAVYRDSLGNTVAPLAFFREQGWNAIRLRIFVNPTATSEGVVQDLPFVVTLAKRIKAAGYQFMLDFHYSDYWADPSKQAIPASWKVNTAAAALEDSLYAYTRRCLLTLTAAGAAPDLIQTGNEISYGMLWDVGKVNAYSTSNWDVFSTMLKRAVAACREVCPKAKVIIHTERSGDATTSVRYYTMLKQYGVDYDIIGLSYYPFWHGSLSTLEMTLTNLESTFPDKKIMIVEFGYYHAYYKGDYDYTATYPATPAGQKSITDDCITLLLKHPAVNGLFWWYPEENSALNNWLNYGLFDCYNGNKALPALYELQRFK